MIVNDGRVLLQESQRSYLATLYWGLFISNTTIAAGTVFADLTEAAWTGYSRVLAGTFAAATLVGTRGQTVPVSVPIFLNSSGGTETFYGWFLYDNAASKLVAAVNIGSTSIVDGGMFALAAAVSDTQE